MRNEVVSASRRGHVERFLKNKTIRQSLIVFSATMFANVLNYLYHMLSSRMLGVAGYGALATLVAGYSIFGAFVNVLNLTTAKFAAEFRAVADTPRMAVLARTMMNASIISATVLIFAALAALGAISAYVHINSTTIIMAVLATAAALLVPSWRGVLQGVQDYSRLSISTTIESAVRLLTGIGLVSVGNKAAGAITGFTIGSIVSLAYTAIALRVHIPRVKNDISPHIDTRRLIKTSGGVALSTFALTIIGFVDVLLVRHFLSAYEAGLYGVLSLTGKIIIFSVSFLPTLLLPKAVDRAMRGENAWPVLMRAIAATAGFSILVVGIYFAFPSVIVGVMAGQAFLGISSEVGRYGVATALLAATTLAATFKIGIHEFGFVARLLGVAVLEVVAICFFHRDIAQVVDLVIAANILALVVTLLPEKGPWAAQGIP